MQITESMIAIILILIVGAIMLVFFFNKAKVDYDVKLSEFDSLDAMQTAQIVSSLDEFTCTGSSDICFDTYKIEAFQKMWDSTDGDPQLMIDNYYELFKESYIYITVYELDEEGFLLEGTHPVTGEEHPRVLELYNNKPLDVGQPGGLSPTIPINLPIYLENSASGASDFAILTVERYHQAEAEVKEVIP